MLKFKYCNLILGCNITGHNVTSVEPNTPLELSFYVLLRSLVTVSKHLRAHCTFCSQSVGCLRIQHRLISCSCEILLPSYKLNILHPGTSIAHEMNISFVSKLPNIANPKIYGRGGILNLKHTNLYHLT